MKLIDVFTAGLGTVQSSQGTAAVPTVSSVGEGGTNNSLLDWISRGADVYKNIKGADTIVPPNTPSSTTPGEPPKTLAQAKWLPWALGAGALLLLGLIFFRR